MNHDALRFLYTGLLAWIRPDEARARIPRHTQYNDYVGNRSHTHDSRPTLASPAERVRKDLFHGIVREGRRQIASSALVFICVAAILFSWSAAAQSSMIPYAASRYAQDQATVQFDADAEEYVFINTEVEPSVAYRLNLKDGRLQQGNLSITVRVEDRFLLIPVHQGGFYVRNAQGQILSPSDAASPQTGTDWKSVV